MPGPDQKSVPLLIRFSVPNVLVRSVLLISWTKKSGTKKSGTKKSELKNPNIRTEYPYHRSALDRTNYGHREANVQLKMYIIKDRPETQTETKIQDFKINRKLEK